MMTLGAAMATSNELTIDRRYFIGVASALAASVALPARALALAPATDRLGDAHAHLFNLADLPARGFFQHAVMWNTDLDFWVLRPMWPAMLDMIAFLKTRAVTAKEELRTYRYDPDPPLTIGLDEFKTISKRRISNMARQSRIYGGTYKVAPAAPLSVAQQHLRDSYRQLAAWFGLLGKPIWRPQPGETADCAFLKDEEIGRIRDSSLRDLIGLSCPEAPNTSSISGPMGTVQNTFGWAHMLMQSRQYLLKAYRDRINDGPLRPTTIVNLLVDYDEWLGDSPAPGSEADAQIALWDRMRAAYSGSIDIRTFAGFDPLKDGLERRGFRAAGAPPGPTTFERHAIGWREGRVHGFKLYPPMGFRPIGNEASMFRGKRRALQVVRARLAECGLAWDALPALLNDSLDALYGYCARHRVPILAHAMHTNDASRCSGILAAPSGWIEVLARHDRGLRICLGHFAESKDFLPAARRLHAGRPVHRRNWPFYGTDRLLRGNGERDSKVFVDLGDMIEFLDERKGLDRAAAFFTALRAYCEDNDRRCEYVMFGTDWIMLERERRSEVYVARVRAGMAAAGWSEQWQNNLLHDNLQRFLNG